MSFLPKCTICWVESDCLVDRNGQRISARLCSDGLREFLCADCSYAEEHAYWMRSREAQRIRKESETAMKALDNKNGGIKEENANGLILQVPKSQRLEPADILAPIIEMAPEAASGLESNNIFEPETLKSIGILTGTIAKSESHETASNSNGSARARIFRKREASKENDTNQLTKTKQMKVTEDKNNQKRASSGYQCQKCPPSFLKCLLEMQNRNHNWDRPYKCSKCPKAFSRAT
ncbi:hypothetical protein KR026_004991 [Drosophila bipectinata]|nr:hypothetical protein KR026_004991 [Drosophila bipectinata]